MLGATSADDIITKFGSSERFAFGEFGALASCHRTPANDFLVFGYRREGSELVLTSLQLGATPPTGHEDSFCKSTGTVAGFNMNGLRIGESISKEKHKTRISAKSSEPRIQILTRHQKIRAYCSTTYERRFVGGKLAQISYTISTNE